jgi:hypothetical protein
MFFYFLFKHYNKGFDQNCETYNLLNITFELLGNYDLAEKMSE